MCASNTKMSMIGPDSTIYMMCKILLANDFPNKRSIDKITNDTAHLLHQQKINEAQCETA